MGLYETEPRNLDDFIKNNLEPNEFNIKVRNAVHRICDFLRNRCFIKQPTIKVIRAVKGGSSGKGTALREGSDADLVVFLSCFKSFQDQRETRHEILEEIQQILEICKSSIAYEISDINITITQNSGIPPKSMSFTLKSKKNSGSVNFDVLPTFDALMGQDNASVAHLELINFVNENEDVNGEFSACFTELQRKFVKQRPSKLKDLIRLLKYWYKQYVKPRKSELKAGARLPAKYAVELLTIYAWEQGSGQERFVMADGFRTVLKLICRYQELCIYWTKEYDVNNRVVADFLIKKLSGNRPIILDPADPTGNVASSTGWDVMVNEAMKCLNMLCVSGVREWDVQPVKGFVIGLDGFSFRLNVNIDNKISMIKERIQQDQNIPAHKQRLRFNETMLIDNKSLLESGIFFDATLHLFMEIFVKNAEGRNLTINVLPTDTVLSLKNKIESLERIPSHQYYLTFQTMKLDDRYTLEYYKIKHHCTININLRLRGGRGIWYGFHYVFNEIMADEVLMKEGRRRQLLKGKIDGKRRREGKKRMNDGYNGLDAVELCRMCKNSREQTEVEINNSQASGKQITPTEVKGGTVVIILPVMVNYEAAAGPTIPFRMVVYLSELSAKSEGQQLCSLGRTTDRGGRCRGYWPNKVEVIMWRMCFSNAFRKVFKISVSGTSWGTGQEYLHALLILDKQQDSVAGRDIVVGQPLVILQLHTAPVLHHQTLLEIGHLALFKYQHLESRHLDGRVDHKFDNLTGHKLHLESHLVHLLLRNEQDRRLQREQQILCISLEEEHTNDMNLIPLTPQPCTVNLTCCPLPSSVPPWIPGWGPEGTGVPATCSNIAPEQTSGAEGTAVTPTSHCVKAGTMGLYETEPRNLDDFIKNNLEPNEFNIKVRNAVHRICDFLRNRCFIKQPTIKVIRAVKGGSSGKGTALREGSDADLVVFLSCFKNFQDQRETRHEILEEIQQILEICKSSIAYEISDINITITQNSGIPPKSMSFTLKSKKNSGSVNFDVLPTFDALMGQDNASVAHLELINFVNENEDVNGEFSACFTELQRKFVKQRPSKLKDLIRLLKYWYKQYVKPRKFELKAGARLPAKYAVELLTIYAWEQGSGQERFVMADGFRTVLKLICRYQELCIYWTKEYDVNNRVVADFLIKKLSGNRPIILDPADPTGNVASSTGWDVMVNEAVKCMNMLCVSGVREWDVQPVKGFVIGLGGLSFRLNVNIDNKISMIKERIQQDQNIPAHKQRLRFNETMLIDNKSLLESGIFFDATLHLFIEISVKNAEGRKHKIEVLPTDTVLSLKNKIESLEHISSHQYYLTFQSRPLEDRYTLEYYEIKHHSLININLRLRGGREIFAAVLGELPPGLLTEAYSVPVVLPLTAMRAHPRLKLSIEDLLWPSRLTVRGLGQVNKRGVEVRVLFLAFLLELSNCKHHISAYAGLKQNCSGNLPGSGQVRGCRPARHPIKDDGLAVHAAGPIRGHHHQDRWPLLRPQGEQEGTSIFRPPQGDGKKSVAVPGPGRNQQIAYVFRLFSDHPMMDITRRGTNGSVNMALYQTPPRKLDKFIFDYLQPDQRFQQQVADTIDKICRFLKERCFSGNRSIKIIKAVKGGSSGKGTALKNGSDADLVVFISQFKGFQDQKQNRGDILKIIQQMLRECQQCIAFEIIMSEPRIINLPSGLSISPRSLNFQFRSTEQSDSIEVDVLPAFDALGQQTRARPNVQVYIDLIEANGVGGEFSTCFTELQRNFVKKRPVKLKGLIRLVKYWYKMYVRPHKKELRSREFLPPKYALELLIIYAWESVEGGENFNTAVGFRTVMELIVRYSELWMFWTDNYNFDCSRVGNFLKRKLQEPRPMILDPADPTGNVAANARWDLVAIEAEKCLQQDCVSDITPWDVEPMKGILVSVKPVAISCPIKHFSINPFLPIQRIKQKFANLTGISMSDYYLEWNDQMLKEDCTLSDYGIFHDVTIFLKNQPSWCILM
ncbi:2'-5'-oligoadenylate synthase 3-like [Heterodontus francisci]|uniref:2'-5'-oligoadenylate synthase 3-like n=1 Tax=Heterodontus francisci TaxID=7792 RepID=UPI00355B8E3A